MAASFFDYGAGDTFSEYFAAQIECVFGDACDLVVNEGKCAKIGEKHGEVVSDFSATFISLIDNV